MKEKEATKKVMKKVRKEILKLYGICLGLGTLMAAVVYFILPPGPVVKPWLLFLFLASFFSLMVIGIIMGGAKNAPVTNAEKIKEEIRELSLKPDS